MSRQAAFKRFGAPLDPGTGVPIQRSGVQHVIGLTERVFRLIAAADYDALAALMDPRTATELPPELIAATWQSALSEVGELVAVRQTRVELADGAVLTEDEELLGMVIGSTTLEFEAGELHGRVAVAASGKVVGLLIVPLGHGPLPF